MKKILTTLLAAVSFVLLMFAAGCQTTEPQPEEPKLAFNEGYLEEIKLGDPIMLDEYIDPLLTNDYTAILTCDETGQERDLKALVQWTTDYPGVYTLTYTVNSGEYQGTVSAKINVVVPEVEWDYTNETLIYRVGQSLELNYLKRMLNLSVKSYYEYEFFMKSVYVDGETTALEGESQFTFKVSGTHTFTFGIKTEDGQVLTATQQVTVRPEQIVTEAGASWLEANNATVHDHTLVDADGKVNLDAGYYSKSYINDNVPYLAFNGEEGSNGYGENTYMMVDFTGKNLPQIAFFCDEVTSSLTDGKNGVYISNGVTLNSGKVFSQHDSHRLTVFGPRKVSYVEFDNKGRMWNTGNPGDPAPISYVALDDNCQYRYIVGFKDCTSTSMTLRIMLINMTTLERVFDKTQKMTGYSANGGSEALNLAEDYYSGSIVLYGRYGHETKLDKVYAPITDVENIYDLDPAAEFKSGFKKNYNLNATANVYDYIDDPGIAYEFTVTDPDGELVEIAEGGYFTYTKSGSYRLYFAPAGNIRPSSTTVRVLLDLTQEVEADYFENEGFFSGGMISNSRWVTNTVTKYVKEGTQSVKYDSMSPSKEYGVVMGLSKEYINYLFLSKMIESISIDVYSEKALNYALFTPNKDYPILKDYTGSIAENEWTTLTLDQSLFMANSKCWSGASYVMAISFNSPDLAPNDAVYIDNIRITLKGEEPAVPAEGQAWLDANNATAYGWQSISGDGAIALNAGYLIGNYSKQFEADEVPYIAFNGVNGSGYGIGNYVMADFTGKNLPQVAFFCDDVTPSLLDGGKGIYAHNGLTLNDGALFAEIDSGRFTLFGPNKVSYCEFDNQGRIEGGVTGASGSDKTPAVISYRGLDDNCQYRYIIGFEEGTNEYAVIRVLLINLTTAERVFDYKCKCTRSTIDGSSQLIDFTNYFTGSIVLYGRYGVETVWDKVYAPVKANSIYELDVPATFKSSYKKQFEIGSTAYVSDYIDVPVSEYDFTVIDPDGAAVVIAADGSFQFTKDGEYRLIYDPKQAGVRASAITIKPVTGTKTDAADAFMNANNMDAYGYETITDDMSVTLNAGTYTGPWYTIANDEVPYVAYNGNYGAGAYVVVDFTGKNVPQLCFFAKEVTSSLVDRAAGFYIHTGMIQADGTIVSATDAGRVTFFGPNKMEYCRPDSNGRVGPQHGYTAANPVNSPLSINGLVDGTHYRYVAGIKSAMAGEMVLELLLLNLDTNEEVVRYETKFTGNWLTADYISGNIVMYSRYNTAITLDKVYAVSTNVGSAYDLDMVKAVLGA